VDGVWIHSAIGGCDGTYGGELGGIEVTATGWLLTINVPNANIANGTILFFSNFLCSHP